MDIGRYFLDIISKSYRLPKAKLDLRGDGFNCVIVELMRGRLLKVNC
ncbi:hypothetical protein A33Q_1725 [Indibacter alkaliphilus LW1]|uniref:Uncharacterized protein n=1 Tax=Indibacter alkaliphilus (strain CCUG 57479 / KCTC 22604 / LW1) TaxID=1189612 RepID=S2DF63_INDAL|nr:hypothetical protein A33Q_1725 [Indibacter alkaliphilus LW1]